MAMKGIDTGQGDERDVPCALQSDLREATGMDRWTGFLQVYGSFITRELTQQHPQFARALCQLERDTRLEQERQSAQILATLRVKDARISELQKVVSEQREQLDVVLDELERRETKEDAAAQTEGGVKATKEIDTQTENREEEKGVLVVLEKLERELKTLEDKNLTLEKELQQRVKRTEKREKLEDNDEIKNCLETLQRGIQAMDLSCGCMRKHLFQPRHCDEHYIVKEFVRALGNGKNGVKDAAKMVRKWAGWEAKHLDESRLEVEKKQVVILKAAKEVCDNERDELLMKVEKLETETLLATINGTPLLRNNKQTNDDDNATLFMLKLSGLEAFELEVIERDEKIMLLQQQLMDQRGSDSKDEYYSHNSRSDRVELMNESLTEGIQNSPTSKDMSKVKDPFLASVKPQTPADRTSGNGCDNEAALPDISALMEDRKRMSLELEECLAKCAYLTSQNSKLAGRLKTAKETNKQHLKEQEDLRTKLSARSETTLEFKETIEEDRDQEYEALREQLASREQENLALVQSLCTIKDKCAQLETIHQKELRLKAAEHAESMESYMSTVNETLSCIESDRNRLEEENSQLRLSVQQLEDDRAQNKLKQSQRCTAGTNTELTFDMDIYTQEKVTLTTRIGDLELQLARERKLVEALEQKKTLQIQHEQQVESDIKNEALKAQQEYEKHCEILQKWREKLRHEFDDYQAVQRAFQQESDKRIEFLSACIEEFARATEVGKTLSTQELYDVVMELSKQHKSRTEDQKYAAFCREDVSLNSDTEQKEPEMK
ncbi:hypothetical protein PInf_016980 [Phytophthora infestans]|nr:hypothetical protein PInf_016980 [Phytophthora infestans]